MKLVAERFGSYLVHESIGSGGMATVHRATIDEGGVRREVALKRLHPELAEDRRFVDDFVREAKLVVGLGHPNIVRLYELGRIDQTYFIAMELVHGRSLLSLMRKAFLQKQLAPIGVVLSIAAELCDALDFAHTSDDGGIVHRDLSPTNLLITDDGHVKIIDFGIARPITTRAPTGGGGAVKGKLGYIAIEALTGGAIDGRADIFSAGVIMWELLACKRLFKARTPKDMLAMVRDEVSVPPSLHNSECSIELDEIVTRAISRSVDERWQSAAAMRRALESVRRHYGDRASPRRVTSWYQRLRAVSTVTGARGASNLKHLTTDELRPAHEAIDHLEDIPDNSYFDPASSPYIDIRVVRSSSTISDEDTKPRIRSRR